MEFFLTSVAFSLLTSGSDQLGLVIEPVTWLKYVGDRENTKMCMTSGTRIPLLDIIDLKESRSEKIKVFMWRCSLLLKYCKAYSSLKGTFQYL